MCVCPISVKNNKLDYDPLVDRLYNYVPCGHCYECLESIKQGYETRSIFEFYHTKKIGGCSFYVTLTYSNKYVPKLPGSDVMCGSKTHLQKWFKLLRKMLPEFKYFFTLEYGSKHFRPHYHGIFFISKYISPDEFQNIIRSSWYYGFVNFGENKGMIKDVRPFQYVSKYCVKDMYHQNFLNSLVNKYGSVITDYMVSDSDYRKDYSLLPFHLQSQDFGLSVLKYLKDIDFIRGYFVVNDILGLNRKMSIPLYILRRALYVKYTNSNGTISYKLNDYGKRIFVSKMKYQYYKLSQDYFDLLNLSLDGRCYESCPTLKKVFTLSSWCDLVRSDLLYNIAPLVSYKLLYHDIEDVPFSFENFFDDLQIFVDCVIKNDWFNSSVSKKYVCPFSDENKLILSILDEIKSFYRYRTYCNNIDNYNRSQFFKKLLTGEYKPKYKCKFYEFVNSSVSLKKYCLCLSTKGNLYDLAC